jgi:hypothetical protein
MRSGTVVFGRLVEREEDWMARQNDTDRLAGDLMKQLLGSLNKPAPGIGSARPQAQVDENSMLETIKGFLNQSLPGTKEREKPGAPVASQPGSVESQLSSDVAGTGEVRWTVMYRRQEREREAMYARQTQEREAMHKRQEQEMEALAGIRRTSDSGAAPYVKPAHDQAAHKPVASSRRAGIVPGKTIGEWSVETDNGSKTFMAVSEEQAFREARRYGLIPTSARLASIHTYTDEEKQRLMSSFGVAGMRESMRAEFEQAIKLGLIPEDAEYEVLANREWGYRVGSSGVVRKGSELIPRRTY